MLSCIGEAADVVIAIVLSMVIILGVNRSLLGIHLYKKLGEKQTDIIYWVECKQSTVMP